MCCENLCLANGPAEVGIPDIHSCYQYYTVYAASNKRADETVDEQVISPFVVCIGHKHVLS